MFWVLAEMGLKRSVAGLFLERWLMWCSAGYYCGLECVLGWAKSRLSMYSSYGLILKFKTGLGRHQLHPTTFVSVRLLKDDA
ncbi:hypothetical protein Tco_0719641 [Tanacetum coccineum]